MPHRPSFSSSTPTAGEWLGGVFPFPGVVTEGDRTFRPETVLWVDGASGLVLATEVAEPGEGGAALRRAAEGLLRNGRPRRLRVAEEKWREALAGLGVEVVVGPTPEVAAVAREMTEHFAGPRGGPAPGYLEGGAAPETVGRFFDAAARFFRSAPWEVIPDDGRCFSVDAPGFKIESGVLSVFGELGESRGMSLFASAADFETFLERAEAARPGGPGVPVRMVSFGKKAELSSRARKEITKYGWESVRGAVPELFVLEPDALALSPREEDYRLATACLEAIAALAQELRAQGVSIGPGSMKHRTPGLPEVRLRYPHPGLSPAAEGDPEEAEDEALRFAEAVREAERAAGRDDEARLEATLEVAAALHRFRAVELGGRPWSEAVLDSFLAWATRQWSLPPEQVPLVPDALVATFRHLERTGEIDGAMAWNLRKRLAATRERYLAEAADPTRFGPAKALLTAAMKAGVDFTDRAALEAFIAREGDRIVAGLNLPIPGAPGPVRAGGRVGRNDPCPCGSGKKYKKCCGQGD